MVSTLPSEAIDAVRADRQGFCNPCDQRPIALLEMPNEFPIADAEQASEKKDITPIDAELAEGPKTFGITRPRRDATRGAVRQIDAAHVVSGATLPRKACGDRVLIVLMSKDEKVQHFL